MSSKRTSQKSKPAPVAHAPKPANPTAAPEPAAPTVKPSRRAARTPEAPRPSGLAAAHQILAEAKQPMRVRDITSATMTKGLWKPAGKTPWSTLAAAIGREIKEKGKQSRFKKTDRGLFAATTVKA